MKPPKYYLSLWAWISLWLGLIFAIFAPLNWAKIMPTAPGSLGNPAIGFSVFAILLVGFSVWAYTYLYRLDRIEREVIEGGKRLTAHVSGVRKLVFTQWNKQNPYRVYFSYEQEGHGQVIKGKSPLLWQLPAYAQGDAIQIAVDAQGKRAFIVEEK